MSVNSGNLQSLKCHALFDKKFVRQHMMRDQNWTADSLNEQLSGMITLLSRHTMYKHVEMKAKRQQYVQKMKQLQLDVLDGRNKLQNILAENNKQKMRKNSSRPRISACQLRDIQHCVQHT